MNVYILKNHISHICHHSEILFQLKHPIDQEERRKTIISISTPHLVIQSSAFASFLGWDVFNESGKAVKSYEAILDEILQETDAGTNDSQRQLQTAVILFLIEDPAIFHLFSSISFSHSIYLYGGSEISTSNMIFLGGHLLLLWHLWEWWALKFKKILFILSF